MKKFLRFLLLIVLIAVGLFAYSGYSKYKSALDLTPLDARVNKIQQKENYTLLEDIPQTFINAMVAVEDRRFYLHNGFDVWGTARAIVTDIKHKKLLEGGSTITQQLAKNIYFPLDKSPQRKLAEIFMALEIERQYSKDEILELYFNVIYYGKGCYNISDAADEFFGKEPIDMTDYECTLLAGMPNAPSVYANNKELARERQEKVLRSMVRSEYITEEDMEEILN